MFPIQFSLNNRNIIKNDVNNNKELFSFEGQTKMALQHLCLLYQEETKGRLPHSGTSLSSLMYSGFHS